MTVIKELYEGLSIEDGKVVYNSDIDNPNDIMNTIEPSIYKSEFSGNIYYFGYTFKDTASRKDRTTVIHWLKNIGQIGIERNALIRLIDKTLLYFDRAVNISDFDCLIYPRSGRSEITKIIVQEVGRFTQRNLPMTSIEVFKSIPSKITFDWDRFDLNYNGEIGDNQYNQIEDYVNNILLPRIHNLSYFSIADSVKYKYRPYIQKYLNISEKDNRIIEAIRDGKILLIDDINTSGSTLTEIIRLIRNVNNKCEIYIFTLIGKE